VGRDCSARAAHLPRAAPRADDLRRRQLCAAARRGRPQHRHQPRPSHFWWQGVDPLAIIEAHGDAIGFAHGKDTLLHPERIRLNGLLDARYPIDPDTASWHFAAVGGGRPLEEWWDLLAALRGAGYDGVVSIEHEDPTLSPEDSIEASAVALREALAWQ